MAIGISEVTGLQEALDARVEQASTLAQIKAASVSKVLYYDGATFDFVSGDFTDRNDDVNIVKADSLALTVGAWVRQNEQLNVLNYVPQSLHAAIQNGTNTDDLSGYFQDAIDASRDSRRPLFIPAGTYAVKYPVRYHNLETDHERAPGAVIYGAGMGRTFIDCSDWLGGAGEAFLTIANDPTIASQVVFLKGNLIADMTLRGKPSVLHNCFNLQAAWYTTLTRLRVNNFGYNGGAGFTGGWALIIGSDTGQTSPDSNPDWTASAKTTIIGCEFDGNAGGIANLANNNGPQLNILESSIRNNARGGLFANSSYVDVGPGTSFAWNGIRDVSGPASDPKANCFGGVQIAQYSSSSYSDGYRAKGFRFMGESDTNYPTNIDLRRAEGAVIDCASISFSDAYYTSAQWAAFGIFEVPDCQVLVGGSDAADRAYATEIRGGTRPSWALSSGALAKRVGGSTWMRAGQYSLGTTLNEVAVNLDLTGNSKAAGRATFSAQPNGGDTITVNGKVYTFKTTLTAADGDVKIGAASTDTVQNLIKAVNLSGTGGVHYSTGMTLHSTVTAIAGPKGEHILFQAKTAGANGDLYTLSATAANVTLSGATFAGGGLGVIGTSIFLLREATKTNAAYNKFQYYTWYEFPRANWPGPTVYQSAFDVPFKRINSPRGRANMDFVFSVPNGSAISVPVPTVISDSGAHYGTAYVSAQGNEATSAAVGYRAATGPECFKISANAAADVATKTVPLTGQTGTDGKLTISAYSDNRLYVENRTSGVDPKTILISFGAIPGAAGQVV